MRQVIYVDVLIAVNFFINYFMLLATAKFLCLKCSKVKLVIGALLGSAYSMYIFLPRLNFIFSILIKAVMAMTIIWVSFGIRSQKTQIKTIICFYSMNFAFSGVMFGIWCLISPNGLMINNGVVYFNISPLVLILSTVAAYTIIQLMNRMVGRKHDESRHCKIGIEVQGSILSIEAEVDTGNSLREPFSNLPVIVIKRGLVRGLIPENVLMMLSLQGTSSIISDAPLNWSRRVRMIPFKAVSGEGLLPSFKPDRVTIWCGDGSVDKEAYIAVCSDSLLSDKFSALINPELVE